jgi:hypothetical protein
LSLSQMSLIFPQIYCCETLHSVGNLLALLFDLSFKILRQRAQKLILLKTILV